MMTSSVKAQKGAVLVVCMIILLMLTVIGISGARNIILQEKMTFASRDAQIALQVAEAAARAAEVEINNLEDVSASSLETITGLYSFGAAPSDIFDPDNWTDANSGKVEVTMGGKVFTGRYFIELLGEPDPVHTNVEVSGSSDVIPLGTYHIFRIVALGRGLGSTERVVVTHQGLRVEQYENN
ncbi:pilus assembly PilX family protein [Microbulbifer sp. SA54]|uniref:pilus assembly PilX family protein n=1 Tax=Microbulbifer sp. SA54 TaxID=3401577 RepID=UPI003AAA812C